MTEIESTIRNRQEMKVKASKRSANQRNENSIKSYSIGEMLLIVIGLPFHLISGGNLLGVFWRLDKYNYRRKIVQRILLTVVSILFWLIILKMILQYNN